MTKIVALGDAHAHPDYDNKRFDVIGEFVASELAGVEDGHFVQIGDWADCSAFNMHGSKIEMEGRRWPQDIDATRDSLMRFIAPWGRRKRKLPKFWLTKGNHGARVDKYIANHPELEGSIGFDELGFEDYGFKVVDFRRVLTIAGVNFTHCLFGQSPSPIKINSPASGFKALGATYVVGHTHIAGYFRHSFVDRTIHGIDLGCAIHKDMGHQENWSCQSAHRYDRGIWVFENVKNGDMDVRYVRLETLGC